MAETHQSFGDTLSSGIQDVAALLPLLGTEQCERQVGSALERGYIYAAASSLSLFGSLGIVKVAFSTFLATIIFPFYGSQWLGNAGFITRGTVSSMVTIDEDTGLYGAEVKLRMLLEEQHIDNPDMVSGFEWSGWRHAQQEDSRPEKGWYMGGSNFSSYCREIVTDTVRMDFKELARDFKAMVRGFAFRWRSIKSTSTEILQSWNGMLIKTSMLSAIISISPYIYLASGNWSNSVSWIYPALRSFGSLLCVVCIQLALQLRIHRIANAGLAWMKFNERGSVPSKALPADEGGVMLEERIRTHLAAKIHTPSTLEKGLSEHLSQTEKEVLMEFLSVDPVLAVYQFLIACGMAMIVAGYVGCFSIVGQTGVPYGPYVWFAMETALSLLRITLWGLNPSWNDDTGLTMTLQLHSSEDPYYPLITSPNNATDLGFGDITSHPKPFTVYSEVDFFAAATAWIGPLQRLEAKSLSLYYALIVDQFDNASARRKYLSITVLLTDSQSYTFLARGLDTIESLHIHTSKLEILSGTGMYQAHLGSRLQRGNDGFFRSQLFRDVVIHAQRLRMRLFGGYEQNQLPLKWNISGPQGIQSPHGDCLADGAPLSIHDEKYINLQKLWDFTLAYIQTLHFGLDSPIEELGITAAGCVLKEAVMMMKSALLEVYLWDRERTFIVNRRKDERLAFQLVPECIYAMEMRIISQRDYAQARYQGIDWDLPLHYTCRYVESLRDEFSGAWDYLRTALQKLRSSTETDNLYREIRWLWNSITDGIDPIMELCEHLLPPSIPEILASITTGTELEDELQCLSLSLIAIAKAPDPNLSAPYVPVTEASDFTLTSIRMNKHLCALKIDPELIPAGLTKSIGRHNLGEYLRSVMYPDQTNQVEQMTTLIIRFKFSDLISEVTREAVAEHIAANPNILCLSGMKCHLPGTTCEQPHCKAVFANRRAWKERAQQSSLFLYRVGFEGGGENQTAALDVKGDRMVLFESGRCFVLFHCPGPGDITITLSVRQRYDSPTELAATMESERENYSETRYYDVPSSRARTAEQVVFQFPNVPRGHGEIGIIDRDGVAWGIRGLVDMQWSPRQQI
ncbi:hypothetical protein VNI00_009155 [Paramarasmius palmivorus]|uniref:Uncharacterized protein n=1 Tax=Paramarasmius palmivorus TaxID=297713 RepID=A0AAW0CUG1_9AGAR